MRFNPNFRDHKRHVLTTLQESVLKKYPFCLNVSVQKMGSLEKIVYELNDLNKKMTEAIVEHIGDDAPLNVLVNLYPRNSGIQIGRDINNKVYAKITSAGGGTRKVHRKAKKSNKTKKLHK